MFPPVAGIRSYCTTYTTNRRRSTTPEGVATAPYNTLKHSLPFPCKCRRRILLLGIKAPFPRDFILVVGSFYVLLIIILELFYRYSNALL